MTTRKRTISATLVGLMVLALAQSCVDGDNGTTGDGDGDSTGDGGNTSSNGDGGGVNSDRCADYTPENCPVADKDCRVAKATPLEVDASTSPPCILGRGEEQAQCVEYDSPNCSMDDIACSWTDDEGMFWATARHCSFDDHTLYQCEPLFSCSENGGAGGGGADDSE